MASVALSMIVRDAQDDLRACLDSAAGAVDEIVIADTGSTDETIRIAREAGATVFSIPWEDDFARARNQALERVTSDWVLVLDADEQLDPDASLRMASLPEHPDAGGYLVPIRNYVWDLDQRLWDRAAMENTSTFPPTRKYPAYLEHENVRLFRRHPDVYFEGRVHETVGHRIRSSGFPLLPATFCIHHFGMAVDADTRARKNHLYRDLGRRKVEEMPTNAQAHFELGLVEFDNFHNYPEALTCFHTACELDPRLSVAWFFAALTHIRLESFADALTCLKHARDLGHAPALVAETQGDALYNLGRFDDARRAYQTALRRAVPSAGLESKLGLAEVRAHRAAAGVARMNRAIDKEPTSAESHDRLILANIWLGRDRDAADAAERKLSQVEPRMEDFMRAASIFMQIGRTGQAEEVLKHGLGHFPDAPSLLRGLEEVQASPSVTSRVAH